MPESELPGDTGERRFGLSLGLRLSLLFALFYAVALLALVGGANLILVRWVTASEQRIVDERADEYAAWFREGGVNALASRFQRQSAVRPEVVFVRVTSPREQVLFTYSPHGEGLVDRSLLEALPYDVTGAHFVAGGEKPDVRWTVTSRSLGGPLVIQVGKNSQEADRVLRVSRRLLFWSILPVTVMAISLGTFTTYRSLQPLRSLMRTMFDIDRTGKWDRRVEVEPYADQELVELSELFNRLLGRNERVIDAMHQSLDNVAHDLRTPMARLRGSAEAALARDEADSAGYRGALEDCLEESREVLRLLEDLMELGEAEAGAMRLRSEPVEIGGVVRSVAELYEFVAEEAGVRLETVVEAGDELVVRGDRTRLQRALSNLVDNALKHAPRGTAVRIAGGGEAGWVRLSVRDEGPGLAEEDRDRIWERLYRGDPSRSQRGMGLGLSFVRAIALAHRGRYGVTSSPGQGAEFSIWLPVDGEDAVWETEALAREVTG